MNPVRSARAGAAIRSRSAATATRRRWDTRPSRCHNKSTQAGVQTMMQTRSAGAIGIAVIGLTLAVHADTLVLRDGNRVEGNVVSLRDGIVEFEARRGFLNRERMRVDVDEVVRIEFDRRTNDRRGNDLDRERDDSRDGRRPSGLREREVSVDSWVPWKDSGIEVRSGQSVYFSASGRVRWGPNRQDGPGGERNSPRNDARPIP